MALVRVGECLNAVLDFLREDLRACCHCGWVWEQTTLLCSKCHSRLKTQLKLRVVNFGSYQVIVPLSWGIDSPLVDSLVYAQKGGMDPRASRFLAELILSQRMEYGSLEEPSILVPVPSSVPKRRDHALALTEALSELTGWPTVQLLERVSFGRSQKRLARDQRAHLKIFSLAPPSDPTAKLILVDDVVTTGSTAAACYQSLGRPKNFEVWALAYRDLCY